ncbi:hypothetical protein KKF34_12885 [Myxococcota bacterium]|nr:hypothetical protein [Myxococcota bacterium]MBU1379975.1 hypothetical protein [Myxococcota bacterium]MBU1497762.1 hypothetical protein [Myxococcota bacterium]
MKLLFFSITAVPKLVEPECYYINQYISGSQAVSKTGNQGTGVFAPKVSVFKRSKPLSIQDLLFRHFRIYYLALCCISVFLISSCDSSEKSRIPFDGFWDTLTPSGINLEEIPENNRFYVDIINGSDTTGDGSISNPWQTLDFVVSEKVSTRDYDTQPVTDGSILIEKNPEAPVKSGDVIILREGHYGPLSITRSSNHSFITIRSEDNEMVTFDSIEISSSQFWKIKNVQITREISGNYDSDYLVRISDHNFFGPTSNIVMTNCILESASDSSDWTLEDWNTLPSNGVTISANHVVFSHNVLHNVNFGISVTGNFVDILNNEVTNFAGDGLRGLGSDMLFEGNIVKNCYDVNENHDDGFQSWETEAGSPSRVVLRNNIIINYTDPNQPFRGQLQGIGCFDGFYTDWIVENNLIVVDHWHGITFLGGRNIKIRNNTVVNRDPASEADPWIRIGPHKDERESSGCSIINNIAVNSIIATADTIDSSNLLVSDEDLSLFFVDHENLDFRPAESSPAIDSANPDEAPGYDIEGNQRDSQPDIGCYEY